MSPAERQFLIEFSDVKRAREEIAIQVALGKAEAEDAFQQLEGKFDEAARKAAWVQEVAQADSALIAAAGALLIQELRHGYKRVRALL